MQSYVVLVTLPGTGERSAVACTGTAQVGRRDDAAIHLQHPLVSRRHAEIAPTAEEQFTVRDLGSRNGTLVDGVRLQDAERVVEVGSTVQVGPYLLTIGVRDDAPDTVVLRTSDVVRRVTLDLGLRHAFVDGEVAIARLSENEFRLLRALEQQQPSATASHELGDIVWGEGQWDAYMLHNLVSRVRRKFEERDHAGDELIVTVPGVGYRLA